MNERELTGVWWYATDEEWELLKDNREFWRICDEVDHGVVLWYDDPGAWWRSCERLAAEVEGLLPVPNERYVGHVWARHVTGGPWVWEFGRMVVRVEPLA